MHNKEWPGRESERQRRRFGYRERIEQHAPMDRKNYAGRSPLPVTLALFEILIIKS